MHNGGMSSDRVWAYLRMTRAEPPGGIRGARRKTYVAALEQAQQMFAAAATVGVATRPLLLFYGLSQGGRAVAAAAKSVSNNDYALRGHGIKANPATLNGPLIEVEVHTEGRDDASFKRLSGILASPTWGAHTPLTLGELWNSLPEGQDMSLDPTIGASPLPASVHSSVEDPSELLLVVTAIPPEVMPSVHDNDFGPALNQFLGRYPTLSGSVKRLSRGVGPFGGGGSVQFAYPASANSNYQQREAIAESHSTRYRLHDRFVFPALGANSAPLHPLLAWWALLFALSMLARYHPESWADHIAVDTSSIAVAIETLLSDALTVVPQILLRTILDVAQ